MGKTKIYKKKNGGGEEYQVEENFIHRCLQGNYGRGPGGGLEPKGVRPHPTQQGQRGPLQVEEEARQN